MFLLTNDKNITPRIRRPAAQSPQRPEVYFIRYKDQAAAGGFGGVSGGSSLGLSGGSGIGGGAISTFGGGANAGAILSTAYGAP